MELSGTFNRNSSLRSSASLPRAAMRKESPPEESSGASIPFTASENAQMPAREVNAMAAKASRAGGGERWGARVCGVGFTVRVGHQSGLWPLRARRLESLAA